MARQIALVHRNQGIRESFLKYFKKLGYQAHAFSTPDNFTEESIEWQNSGEDAPIYVVGFLFGLGNSTGGQLVRSMTEKRGIDQKSIFRVSMLDNSGVGAFKIDILNHQPTWELIQAEILKRFPSMA